MTYYECTNVHAIFRSIFLVAFLPGRISDLAKIVVQTYFPSNVHWLVGQMIFLPFLQRIAVEIDEIASFLRQNFYHLFSPETRKEKTLNTPRELFAKVISSD